MSGEKVTQLPETTAIASSDLLLVTSYNGDTTYTSKKITWGNASKALIQWTQITSFSTTAASTSTITMTNDLTSVLLVGLPIKFKLSGTYYYAQITASVSNLLTIRGAPLTTGAGDLTEVYYGSPDMVQMIHICIPGLFEDATNTALIASDLFDAVRWQGPEAYCVGFDFKETTADSGATQPNCNVRWGNNPISTSNTNAGPLLTASWQSTGIDINTTNYVISWHEALEIECTKGTNGNASDLSIDIIVVIASMANGSLYDNRWTTVNSLDFTAAPASTSTITMLVDRSSSITAGTALRYTIGGVLYYGAVVSCTSNLLTVQGASLGGSVTNLQYGPAIVQWELPTVPGLFEDATATALLASDCFTYRAWFGRTAYMVGFRYKCETADSGATQPNVNVRVGGNRISTSNTNAGPLVSASIQNTGIDINTTNYVVTNGAQIEVECTKGTNGNALDLTVIPILVEP